MFAEAGRWFGKCAKEGQMALIIYRYEWPNGSVGGLELHEPERTDLIGTFGARKGLNSEPEHS